MPLKLWKCKECGAEFKTKADKPVHCDNSVAESLITPPQATFMEKTDIEHGKSALVGQEKILRERARRHSREIELDDLVQTNDREIAHKNGWLKADGTRRRGIDDK